MALEFAIFRVEADACTWQKSPRSLYKPERKLHEIGRTYHNRVVLEQGSAILRVEPCEPKQQ